MNKSELEEKAEPIAKEIIPDVSDLIEVSIVNIDKVGQTRQKEKEQKEEERNQRRGSQGHCPRHWAREGRNPRDQGCPREEGQKEEVWTR